MISVINTEVQLKVTLPAPNLYPPIFWAYYTQAINDLSHFLMCGGGVIPPVVSNPSEDNPVSVEAASLRSQRAQRGKKSRQETLINYPQTQPEVDHSRQPREKARVGTEGVFVDVF